MNTVLFSANLCNFRPLWVLSPVVVYTFLLVLSFIPSMKCRFQFVKGKETLKVFVTVQCIALIGHVYAFTTELLPYYTHHYQIVEGNVENFEAPTNLYNRHESFWIDGVYFDYNDHEITFGYHNTIFDGGIINEKTQNIRVFYVHNPLNDNNIIVRIDQLSGTG